MDRTIQARPAHFPFVMPAFPAASHPSCVPKERSNRSRALAVPVPRTGVSGGKGGDDCRGGGLPAHVRSLGADRNRVNAVARRQEHGIARGQPEFRCWPDAGIVR